MEEKFKLGISSCLLGEQVRYDGGHKLDHFIKDTLGRYVEFLPICPEVECGLPVPREAMRLVGDPQNLRLMTVRTQVDHTEKMVDWANDRVKGMSSEELCGFIFKSKSPSSGIERVKVYPDKGIPLKEGRGIFADIFMKHNPLLPVEDEGRLHDPSIRENFIERVFTLKRWRDYTKAGISSAGLVDFHSRHKLLFMSHSQQLLREMGNLVAQMKQTGHKTAHNKYLVLMTEALKLRTTIKKNTNVLMHMMGYFKQQLSGDEKQELLEIIANYHQSYVPLMAPLTLLNHYVRKYEQPYLREQVYLNPHPAELMLRNHV
ncbi:MAG: DUF523 and DUF1722 domain-containing protein [bacterium]|nr:DUF523 and DUF1722 domain-containing protein [bacterium]